MATNILTQEDKTLIIPEIKQIISQSPEESIIELNGKRWLKSYQVMRMLGVSTGTLQNLRINRQIPFTKIGGSLYYPYDGIIKQLNDNLRNSNGL